MPDALRRRPVLALAGPTASGKTAVALALAQALPVEVVSVDSALVYRGMDIGTAKPGVDERQSVPHHLIDLIGPTEAYSAARFVDDALAAIDDIRARGREPLLVGGTMLYFKALSDGLDAMPAADAAVRAQLEADAQRQGWPALHAQLSRLDPATAARLAPHDAQRIERALEVVLTTGRPLSDWQQRDRDAADPAREARRQPVLLLSLEPRDRGWLHARIAERLRTMAAAGFEDEVRRLRERGDLHAGLPSMRCVGYRQLWEALDDGSPAALAAWPERAIAATRQLAKRQLTWLRSWAMRTVVDCDAPDAQRLAVEALMRAQRTLAA